jgi:hypothetical protein
LQRARLQGRPLTQEGKMIARSRPDLEAAIVAKSKGRFRNA